ncbi:transposase InsO family protein [Bradyrhizobium sp. USDA 326]
MCCSSGRVNHKKLFRLYLEERLAVRRRGGRKRAIGTRAPMTVPMAPNDRRSLDFVSGQLTCGRRFRILTVVDDCTRECLPIPRSPASAWRGNWTGW